MDTKNSIIYRDYSQAELDQQYLPTSCIDKNIAYYVNQYQALSKLVQNELSHNEHGYGAAPSERLDFFPCHLQNSPLHIFIHGGFWRMSDKSDVAFLAREFVQKGINFSAINYVLAPNGSMADIIAQARKAIIWFCKHQQKLKMNSKLTISGHSAGAQIALILAATDWSRYGINTQPITGVVGISGIYDLEPIRLSYVNTDLRLSSDDIAKFSPIQNLPQIACPIDLVYGEYETNEFKRQSQFLSTMLQEKHIAHTCTQISARNHFDILFDMTEPSTTLAKLCLAE